jgi:hypothetical protein
MYASPFMEPYRSDPDAVYARSWSCLDLPLKLQAMGIARAVSATLKKS